MHEEYHPTIEVYVDGDVDGDADGDEHECLLKRGAKSIQAVAALSPG